jgi:hypothetical protein
VKKIQQSSVIIANNLDILQGSVQTRQKELVVFYVARILMIVLNVPKKCVLSVTKLVIKPKSVKKLKIFNALNAIQLVMKRIDV